MLLAGGSASALAEINHARKMHVPPREEKQ
jgi:hypothetical protein